MYKIIKFIYFVLIRFICYAEWIEVTNSHKPSDIFTKSNLMHGIQPMVNLNPIIKNSYVLDEFLNFNLSNGKSKVQLINQLASIPSTTTIEPNLEENDEITEVHHNCNNCTFSTESSKLGLSNITEYKDFMKTSNNLDNILDFMNEIQKSFNVTTWPGKINVLNTLKTNLITNIETRLESLFPAKKTSAPKRRKRGIITSEGHMDFPSAEGALITICFLTFAVFLIKLVLQVINTIKSKHYSYNGMDQATMSAVKMMKSHKLGKSISDEKNYDTAKILSSIFNHKTSK